MYQVILDHAEFEALQLKTTGSAQADNIPLVYPCLVSLYQKEGRWTTTIVYPPKNVDSNALRNHIKSGKTIIWQCDN